jgi:hypothetical protein
MEFNWSILGWIAALLFVYAFGLVEGRGKGYKKRKAEEDQERSNRPPANPEPVVRIVDDPGLLRIRQERGAFSLDLDGTRLDPSSISADQRKRLIEILNVVRPWLEGKAAPASVGNAAMPPARSTPPAPAAVQLAATSSPVSPPQASPAGDANVTPSRPASPRPGTIAKEDRPVSPANSIVSQIDTVLQTRLADTPLEERGIFLTESPEGGVAVYVGLTRYHGIDEVPDAEIKAAIRAAIKEWEDSYTPGL